MKTIQHSRLAALTASISAALLLSACQPASDVDAAANMMAAEETASVENPATNTTTDAHRGHNMSGGTMTTAGGHMMGMHHKEYNDSMNTMHEQMMVGMDYNDPDAAFAQGMLGHHMGAVDMAEIQLKNGQDGEMRQLAQDIIAAQQSEIKQMQTWLASHPETAKPSADTKAMQQAYAKGMDTMHGEMMAGIADPNADMAFARGMLPHHVGAVDMAKVQLKYGKDAEMRQLAQEIIDAQQPEIEQMQNWITKQGAQKPSV